MQQEIQRLRRNQVMFTIKFNSGSGKMTLDLIVKKTGYSQKEVSEHIAALIEQEKVGVHEDGTFFYQKTEQDIIRDFNLSYV